MNRIILTVLLGAVFFLRTRANDSPKPSIPENTFSADKRYGITVPLKEGDGSSYSNTIVELKSMHKLGEIDSASMAYQRMNHAELLPVWWSADDSYFLWQVNGKWGMEAQLLVCLKDGEIKWELDVIKVLQRQILNRTEAADPKKFLEVKKENWGNGRAYPEKFIFDSQADNFQKGPLIFPIHFNVYLTSDVKNRALIDANMRASLDKEGNISIEQFHIGKISSSPWNEIQAAGNGP